MGLVELKITFREIRKRLRTRAGRGIVAVILKDKAKLGITKIKNEDSIPTELTEENKKIVSSIFLGNTQNKIENEIITEVTYKPTEVILCTIDSETGTIDEALNQLEGVYFNILTYPDAAEEDNTKIASFIKKINEEGDGAMAVISPATAPDCESIINWQTDNVVVKGEKISKSKYCARIAGLIAGTPYSQAITYATLNDVESIPTTTKEESNTAIDAGKLIAISKGGVIRIARGVTSLTTTDNQKRGDSFKKIKLVQTYYFLKNSIRKAIIEQYLGKVSNNYDNKCLLINEINLFLREMAKEELIEGNFTVNINLEAQKSYLKSVGVKVDDMTDDEIKRANTGSHVFISIAIKAVDAMEDFVIDVEV